LPAWERIKLGEHEVSPFVRGLEQECFGQFGESVLAEEYLLVGKDLGHEGVQFRDERFQSGGVMVSDVFHPFLLSLNAHALDSLDGLFHAANVGFPLNKKQNLVLNFEVERSKRTRYRVGFAENELVADMPFESEYSGCHCRANFMRAPEDVEDLDFGSITTDRAKNLTTKDVCRFLYRFSQQVVDIAVGATDGLSRRKTPKRDNK